MPSPSAREAVLGLAVLIATREVAAVDVKTAAGLVQGTTSADGRVEAFLGIPYAAPPVGELRWREPRPVAPWQGVRQVTRFGPRCLQGPIYSDMVFRDEPSEDCLYLNVWAPAPRPSQRLPVMVWIHGGGFQAGSGSEPRQDGERLARKGVVAVTLNYRLGAFGFLAHPELSRGASRRASGNYGLLDVVAALAWTRDNIVAFGGDARNVTIFGESAGSLAVSALMASPRARGLFHKAIGESGAYFMAGDQPLTLRPLAASEQLGVRFAAAVGAESLAALRAKPADDVLRAALETQPWFGPNLDGRFLTEQVYATYAAGRQSRVPLLAGWNADEIRAGVVLGSQRPTAQSFAAQTRERFGAKAAALLEVYPAGTDAEALESAAALASDMFIGYATWKWIDVHAATSGAGVYRYSFDRKIPVPPDTVVNGTRATARDVGARHAGEIEYVFGALDSLPGVPWEPGDRRLSEAMMTYWTNFARQGDPNDGELPKWPRYRRDDPRVLHLDETIREAPDAQRPRYQLLDAYVASLRSR